MEFASLLQPLPAVAVPKVTVLMLAVPIVVMMGAALVALVAVAGPRVWRFLLVLVCVPAIAVAVLGGWLVIGHSSRGTPKPRSIDFAQDIESLGPEERRRLQERLAMLERDRLDEGAVEIVGSPEFNTQDGVGGAGNDAADRPAPPAGPSPPVAEVAAEADLAELSGDAPQAPSSGTSRQVSEQVSEHISEHDGPRPAWIDAPRGNQRCVTIGPFSTPQECTEKLHAEVARAVADYNQAYLARYGGTDRPLVRSPVYSLDLSNEEQRYEETSWSELLGKQMYSLHVLLGFDEKYRRELDDCWRETMVAGRLTRVALFSGMVLAFLTPLYLYLRLDLATDGCYTRRLQCAAAGAILALLASGALLTRWIPWW